MVRIAQTPSGSGPAHFRKSRMRMLLDHACTTRLRATAPSVALRRALGVAAIALPLLAVTGGAPGFAEDRLSLPAAETAVSASPATRSEETVFIEDDNLAVTVAAASFEESDPLDSEFSIWVGQIDMNGRPTIWVELIDRYGEVIYDSEVGPNETHLLPDGRAIVVRSVDPATRVAKLDEDRLALDGAMVVTRRVVEDENLGATSVEFMEARPPAETKEPEPGVLMHLALFGTAVWQTVAALVSGAAETVQVAWNWLIGTLQA